MHPWLPAPVFAPSALSREKLLGKRPLADLGTRKLYLLSALISLLAYSPYLAFKPPGPGELLAAFALACLMAVTFGITSQAIQRGPFALSCRSQPSARP